LLAAPVEHATRTPVASSAPEKPSSEVLADPIFHPGAARRDGNEREVRCLTGAGKETDENAGCSFRRGVERGGPEGGTHVEARPRALSIVREGQQC
jgi:hypothetical protein